MLSRGVLAGCASVALLVGAAPAFAVPDTRLAHNVAAAHADAAAHLKLASLPAGAVHVAREPSGDHGWLRPLPTIIATTAYASLHRWWTSGESQTAVLNWIESHPPAGGHVTSQGAGGGNGFTSASIEYDWPARAGTLNERLLQFTLTTVAGGRTGILAESESVYAIPRSRNEVVPAGVHEVEITAAANGSAPDVRASVRGAPTVARIVRMFDAMGVAQPYSIACPSFSSQDARVIDVVFRARVGGPALARAQWLGPTTDPFSGECDAVSFWIRGRSQTPLIGGDFVHQLQRLLHVRLARG